MKVKQLINELLDMPMNAEVEIVYINEDYDYEYQEVMSAIYYDEEHQVGIVGTR